MTAPTGTALHTNLVLHLALFVILALLTMIAQDEDRKACQDGGGNSETDDGSVAGGPLHAVITCSPFLSPNVSIHFSK